MLSDFTEDLQTLPEPFLKRMEQIIPSEMKEQVFRSFIEEPMTCFRINTLKIQEAEAIQILKKSALPVNKIEWLDNAYCVTPSFRTALMETDLYRQNTIYIQNLSSMIPPVLLNPTSNEKVLDLAAAPGSKTLQLAAMMGNDGNIMAIELVRKRYYKLLDNLRQHGAENVDVFNTNGETVWKRFAGQFDKILIDAPCSTEARFRVDDEETYRYWSMRKVKEMVRKQSRLLFSAIQSLRVGGTLIYSTCSFAPEENEGVVDRLMQKFGDSLTVQPLSMNIPNMQTGMTRWKKKSYHPSVANCLRILPNQLMEGFFVCKMTKTNITK